MTGGKLGEQWRSYRAAVLPGNAPGVQVQECRRAFYAGAEALRAEFLATPDDPRGEGEAIAALEHELDGFVRLVEAGLA